MYVLVYENKVLVGPMAWNRAMFQGALTRKGMSVNLPRVAPQELPYIVNDDVKIMLVTENRPELNPLLEYYYGPLWEITETQAIANYEVKDSPIESMRYNLKELVAAERFTKEVAGTKTTIQGHEVSVDTARGSRDIFVQKFLLMGDNDTVGWKFPETWLTLTKSDLGQIVLAGATHIQTCFDWERNLCDQIDAATTKEELIDIQIIEPVVETDE